MPTVRDIMTRDVFTVSPELSLTDLTELLTSRHIGGVPVVEGRKVVGVVSATDVLGFATSLAVDGSAWVQGVGESNEWSVEDEEDADLPELSAESHLGEWDLAEPLPADRWDDRTADGRRALREFTVGDVMSREVQSLPPGASIAQAAEFMRRTRIHRVLVMDGGELLGLVSTMDIVSAVASESIPAPLLVMPREVDFDSGWSREPIVRES